VPLQVFPPKFNPVNPGVGSHKRYKVSPSGSLASREPGGLGLHCPAGLLWAKTGSGCLLSQAAHRLAERGHADTGNFMGHCRRRSRLSLQADTSG